MKAVICYLFAIGSVNAQQWPCCGCPGGGSACTNPGTYGTVCNTDKCTPGYFCTGGPNQCGGRSTCPAGMTSLAGAKAESDCFLCPAGTTLNGGVCSSCPAGKSSPGGSTECTFCAGGSYAPATGSACLPCARGMASSAVGATVPCPACPPGTITSTPGATACAPCEAGLYAPVEGSTWCAPCPPGTAPGPVASDCSPLPASNSTSPSATASSSHTPTASSTATATAAAAGVGASSAGVAAPAALALSFFGGSLTTAVLGGMGLLLHWRGDLQRFLGGTGPKAAPEFRVNSETSETQSLLYRR